MSIAENVARVRERIAAAASRVGRDPASIRLIGASAAFKGVTDAMVESAYEAGLRDFGENRVQEATKRIQRLRSRLPDATWHFIGHLQTNKAPDVLNAFDIIQSVDSLRLAQQIDSKAGAPVTVLLEVNIAGEASKFGFAPQDVADAVASISNLPNIDLRGLMTVALATGDPQTLRLVFRQLRELANANGLKELSMGMTDDFEVAVEEGATIVRVGRAIFRERV